MGALGGSIPHTIRAIAGLNKNEPGASAPNPIALNSLKPGFRMAGGLTGMILGGGLGAGMAAMMKKDQTLENCLERFRHKVESWMKWTSKLAQNASGDITTAHRNSCDGTRRLSEI